VCGEKSFLKKSAKCTGPGRLLCQKARNEIFAKKK
jgi:hypothetical protein